MKIIIITRPHFFKGEATAVNELFQAGLEILHLRKPEALAEEMEQFIQQIPEEFRNRIVIHDHFLLAERYGLKGIHLNRRNSNVPEGYTGQVSYSCHSIAEIEERKNLYDYVFLSPIYDSISKTNYAAGFSIQELQNAQAKGIIDHRVMALGGMEMRHLPQIKALGFGGAVFLGDVWNHLHINFIPYFTQLLHKSINKAYPVILSIAGSDSCGGAGIQADIKTISALNAYAASAITAVTAQNTIGVQAVYPLTAEMVRSQICSVMDDLFPEAIKIGMLPDASIIHTIAQLFLHYRPRFVVCDPVMVSTSGRRLMNENAVQTLQEELFPLCTLLTPNLNEAELLYGSSITTPKEMEIAARTLALRYNTSVLLKGGHLKSNEMCDVLCQLIRSKAPTQPPSTTCIRYTAHKIESNNLHGTGCTLSSAIATHLAQGNSLPDAITHAKSYVIESIKRGKDLHIGEGNGPLGHFPLS